MKMERWRRGVTFCFWRNLSSSCDLCFLLLPHTCSLLLAPAFIPMAEWGPFGVTDAEVRRIEENGLALEEVLAVGWHPRALAS